MVTANIEREGKQSILEVLDALHRVKSKNIPQGYSMTFNFFLAVYTVIRMMPGIVSRLFVLRLLSFLDLNRICL